MTPNTPQALQKLLDDQGVLAVLDFPPQSPDLNPIEHLLGPLED